MPICLVVQSMPSGSPSPSESIGNAPSTVNASNCTTMLRPSMVNLADCKRGAGKVSGMIGSVFASHVA